MAATEKTFGQAFGELIRAKRGQESLTQKELAIRAFDDESKVRRIASIESGEVTRPHPKTLDALVVYFGITQEEMDRCRNFPQFTKTEEAGIGLPRQLLENLAQRFEYDNPDASDSELLNFLKGKASELSQLKKRLKELEGLSEALDNQIKSANAAVEVGDFDEADNILAAAEEIQQEERTLKEVSKQSEIRFTRADTALFRGDVDTACKHYIKAAEYFSGFDAEEVAARLSAAAGQVYEYARRTFRPSFLVAIDLAERSLTANAADNNRSNWVLRKYRLALLQQTQARSGDDRKNSFNLLNEAIGHCEEAMEHVSLIDPFDRASIVVLLGNCYHARSLMAHGIEKDADLKLALDTYEGFVTDTEQSSLTLHRGHIYNNISLVYDDLAERKNGDEKASFIKKSKEAVVRAIELSEIDGVSDIWAAAQHNLGKKLWKEGEDSTGEKANFLRVRAISAFNSSCEGYLLTAFHTQLASTQHALGRLLLRQAMESFPAAREIYLTRSINAFETAIQIYTKETAPQMWGLAIFNIGLANFLHAEMSPKEIAIGDLNRAISLYDEAAPALESPGMAENKVKLQRAKAAAIELREKLNSN